MNRKTFIALGVVLLLFGGIGSVLTYKKGTVDASEKKAIDSADITDIEVESDNISVKMEQTDGEDIIVELDGVRRENSHKEFQIEEEDGRLHVQFEDPSWELFNFDLFELTLDMTLSIPKERFGTISVDNTNGKIQVSDIKADEFIIQTNNGRINLDRIEGMIDAKTTNGGVELHNPTLEQDIALETTNGSITVQTDERPENAIILGNTANGSVHLFGKDGSAVFGEGANTIELDTTNGSIDVEEN